MRLTFIAGATAVATLALVPALAAAQPGGVATACTIDQNNPKELALLSLKLQQARGAASPDVRRKALSDIAKELDTKPERFAKNPATTRRCRRCSPCGATSPPWWWCR